MATKMLNFNKWFKAQFGKDPVPHLTIAQAQANVCALTSKRNAAIFAMDEKMDYVIKRDAALKAYTATAKPSEEFVTRVIKKGRK